MKVYTPAVQAITGEKIISRKGFTSREEAEKLLEEMKKDPLVQPVAAAYIIEKEYDEEELEEDPVTMEDVVNVLIEALEYAADQLRKLF